jgi:DUF1680 family protein
MKYILATLLAISIYRANAQTAVYKEVPLGNIKPGGWLREMLLRQKSGSTGKMDRLYPSVMGKRNGWLGGDGDQWERGPYWVDGLLPLAYILNDKELIAKVKPWVEWSIKSQTPDGYFGPSKDYPEEEGLQRDNSRDWWPKMVMLKVLQQYYSATNDKRVIKLMTNYFSYQLKQLPQQPLDHWTYWAKYRAGDNLQMVYWLYDITKEKFLLDLAELIHQQAFDFSNAFANTDLLRRSGSIHTVNLAQGLKEPIIYSQHHSDRRYLEATQKGLKDLDLYDGMAHGLYGGDEALHGNNPTQGSELCTAVEMMYSLESVLALTGEVNFADRLEKIAFNALPTQISDDFETHQYFQQANQVNLSRGMHNFADNHGGTDLVYGLLTGYPCCASNMHQGWPKFTQNLWYTTADSGIAALVYAPSELRIQLPDNIKVAFREETNYPFEESIRFTVESSKKATFPFHLRIPAWCKKATVKINGKVYQEFDGNQIVKISREWVTGDVVELQLPMHIFKNKWYENSVSIERGPLTFALKVGEEVTKVDNLTDPAVFGSSYYEVKPSTAWNYALFDTSADKLAELFTVEYTGIKTDYPWNQKNIPIRLKTTAKKIPSWTLYQGMAGPIPYSKIYGIETANQVESITLVPYGCTTLRISQFPVINK